ncbi:MAG: AbrB/MazE/SpoVT family DNA-binding domain-containing protein [Candidatus Woesearchaeota archaeon]
MDVAITRMSSKGQIVIPAELRKGLIEGDKLLIIKENDNIILRKASALSKNFLEDIEFANKTAESWKKYENGEFKEMEFDEFMTEMKKW